MLGDQISNVLWPIKTPIVYLVQLYVFRHHRIFDLKPLKVHLTPCLDDLYSLAHITSYPLSNVIAISPPLCINLVLITI